MVYISDTSIGRWRSGGLQFEGSMGIKLELISINNLGAQMHACGPSCIGGIDRSITI
jgi:hypothetical protein